MSYLEGRQAHGDREIHEVTEGSALPRDYGNAPWRMVSYRWQPRRGHRGERELFPGAAPLALGAIAAVPPLTPAVIATLTAGAAAFDLSLGFNGLIFNELYQYSAAFRGMRVIARFAVMVQAALVLLAAFGSRRLLGRVRGAPARGALCAGLCLAVLVDLRTEPGLRPYLPGVPAIYERVTPAMVLAELPGGHPVDYMYFSTRHWARLLTGYSGFFPDMRPLEAAENAFPSDRSLTALRGMGATHLTYNCAFEKANGHADADCARIVSALDANPTLRLLASEKWNGSDVRLYQFTGSH